jgi:hypothetical protein
LLDSTEPQAAGSRYASVTKANNGLFQVQQGSTDNLLDVTANDFDSQGFPFTVFFPQGTISTPHGTLKPSSDWQGLLYTPVAGFFGTDTFTYAIVNDFNQESSSTNIVFVTKAGDQSPVADKA